MNEYLGDADDRRAAGELSALSFRDDHWTGERIVEHFGRSVDPTQIRPTEFAGFRNALAAKYAPSQVGKTVTVCRMMFRWTFESEVIDAMPRFGPNFKAAAQRSTRLAKAKADSKAFEAKELRTLVKAAPQTLSAMILLGINGGLGNMDVSALPLSAVDLKRGWIDFPRSKTGIARRVPLWPETVDALRAVIANRAGPQTDELTERVFLTSRGGEWVVVHDEGEDVGKRVDKITVRFRDLLKDHNAYRKGRVFYGLRHTLETVAGGAKDQVALDAIMSHVDDSMADTYRHGVEDERLRAVTDQVRQWLFPNAKPKRTAKAGVGRANVRQRNCWSGCDGRRSKQISAGGLSESLPVTSPGAVRTRLQIAAVSSRQHGGASAEVSATSVSSMKPFEASV